MSLFRYSKIHSFHSFEDKDRVFAHFREQIPYLIAVFLQLLFYIIAKKGFELTKEVQQYGHWDNVLDAFKEWK